MPMVAHKLVTWPMAVAGLVVAALVPVLAFAVILHPMEWMVLAIGTPLALAVAFLIVLPLCALLSREDRLNLAAMHVIGAAAASIPFLAAKADLIERSLTGRPYTDGLKESAHLGVWYVKNGFLTPAGWLNEILWPLLLFAALGAIGVTAGWLVATWGALPPGNDA